MKDLTRNRALQPRTVRAGLHTLPPGSGRHLKFDLHGQQAGLKSSHIPVNAQIAKVR